MGSEKDADLEDEADRDDEVEEARRMDSELPPGEVGGRLRVSCDLHISAKEAYLPFCDIGVVGLRGA